MQNSSCRSPPAGDLVAARRWLMVTPSSLLQPGDILRRAVSSAMADLQRIWSSALASATSRVEGRDRDVGDVEHDALVRRPSPSAWPAASLAVRKTASTTSAASRLSACRRA